MGGLTGERNGASCIGSANQPHDKGIKASPVRPPALPCNAYYVCTLSLAPLPGAEPAARRRPVPGCRARAASPCSRARSSSPRKTPRQSARPSIRAGSSPQRSSCAGCSPASPIPSMPGHVPGRSHAGSRWYCRRGRLCDHPSWRAGEWVAAPRVPWSVGRRLAGATVTRSLRCRCDRGATPLSRPGPGLPRQSDPRGQPKAHDVVPPEGAPCLSPARHCS